MRQITFLIKAIFFSVLFVLSGAKIAYAEVLNVYVVPQYNPAQIHADWTPLLKRLSQDTGFDLQLVVMPSIPKFEQALLKGLPDIVLVNPYHAVMAKSAKAYMPFLRDAKPLTGILLVRQDSPYQSIQDLKGKEIGFPAPNAFGASLFLRALLTDAKVNFTEKYLNTHGNVYRHILNGTVAAGGGINLTLNEEPIEIRSQLRVLYQTPASAPHPLMAHPRVAPKKIEALSNAIMALRREPQGLQLLKQVRMPEPTIADYERDYLPLEKLEIEKFVVIEKD